MSISFTVKPEVVSKSAAVPKINERLTCYHAGATLSTKPDRSWIIVYTEHCASKSESLKRENYLKKMKSRMYIEDLIRQSQEK